MFDFYVEEFSNELKQLYVTSTLDCILY